MPKEQSSLFTGQPSFSELQDHLAVLPAIRDLIWEHRLGGLVAELCPAGSRGRKGVPGLAAALGGGQVLQNQFWYARAIFAAFRVDELEEVQRAAEAVAFALGVSHLTSTISLPGRTRTRILSLCINQRWTVTALRREVRKLQGGQKLSGGGAPPATPKSAEDALDEIIERTSTWLNRFQASWFHGDGAAFGRPIDPRTVERLRDKMREAEDVLGRLRRFADSGRRNLRRQRQQ
jgi:hypothetical protein